MLVIFKIFYDDKNLLKKIHMITLLSLSWSKNSNIGTKRPIIGALSQFIKVESAMSFSDSISAI